MPTRLRDVFPDISEASQINQLDKAGLQELFVRASAIKQASTSQINEGLDLASSAFPSSLLMPVNYSKLSRGLRSAKEANAKAELASLVEMTCRAKLGI